ncbi:hypothetical protein [Methanococcus voltae]|uniref:hypothetical protein n=1 Tax=Methanococcus voltae TaxID=2188 RepID=UPI001AE2FF83|nr:hypothetical protein [Methanococcus voltae]MBP2173306.1 hypothetical protein [Methanococcus voltae]
MRYTRKNLAQINKDILKLGAKLNEMGYNVVINTKEIVYSIDLYFKGATCSELEILPNGMGFNKMTSIDLLLTSPTITEVRAEELYKILEIVEKIYPANVLYASFQSWYNTEEYNNVEWING